MSGAGLMQFLLLSAKLGQISRVPIYGLVFETQKSQESYTRWSHNRNLSE